MQGNTSNIVFLKSTDDSMLDTLQKMSGTTHRVVHEGVHVTRDKGRLFFRTSDSVSEDYQLKEFPVISYNDMAFIGERNSIVFRAGDSPIWNRNQTILPMSWRLFQNTIVQPGKEYSLQTIPTLSSALEFDVRKNQPDFIAMWEHRRKLAKMAASATEKYQKAYGLSDFEMSRLEQDDLADELMEVIETMAAPKDQAVGSDTEAAAGTGTAEKAPVYTSDYEDNDDIKAGIKEAEAMRGEGRDEKRYAGGFLSRDDLISMEDGVTGRYDHEIIKAYLACRGNLVRDTEYFMPDKGDGSLRGRDGTIYIRRRNDSEALNSLNDAAKDPRKKVYMQGDGDTDISVDVKKEDLSVFNTFAVERAFYKFLASLDSWDIIAGGIFEKAMADIMNDV